MHKLVFSVSAGFFLGVGAVEERSVSILESCQKTTAILMLRMQSNQVFVLVAREAGRIFLQPKSSSIEALLYPLWLFWLPISVPSLGKVSKKRCVTRNARLL